MELIEEIKTLVSEELSLSDVVNDTTKNVLSLIIKDSKNCGTKKTEGELYTNIFGKRIKLIYHIHRVNLERDLLNVSILNPGYYNESTDTLETTIIYVKEKNRYVDYAGTTRHEIKHIYQTIKSGKPLLFGKSLSIYKTASDLRKSRDFYTQVVGYTIYYANNFEKDAITSSIYSMIENNPAEDPYELIKNTPYYKNIKIIHDVLENVTEITRQTIENICQKYFGKHFNWWKNIAKKICSGYINRVGKILTKIEKDRNEGLILRDDPVSTIHTPEHFQNDDE